MLQETILSYVHGVIRGVLRRLVFALVGALLASFGIVCILLGLVKFLTLLVPEWMAWTIIGSHALLIGVLVVIVSMPRRR
jgi:hypothetical protein